MATYLHIKICEAKDIIKSGNDRVALFICLNGDEYGGVITNFIKNTGNPIWNQDLCLKSENKNKDILQLEIRGDDYSIEYMDLIKIPLKYYNIGSVYDYQSKIKLEQKDSGSIHFKFELLTRYA